MNDDTFTYSAICTFHSKKAHNISQIHFARPQLRIVLVCIKQQMAVLNFCRIINSRLNRTPSGKNIFFHMNHIHGKSCILNSHKHLDLMGHSNSARHFLSMQMTTFYNARLCIWTFSRPVCHSDTQSPCLM